MKKELQKKSPKVVKPEEKKSGVVKDVGTFAKNDVPEVTPVDTKIKPVFIETGRMKISLIVTVAGQGKDVKGGDVFGNIPSAEQSFFDYYNVQDTKQLKKEIIRNTKSLVKDVIKRFKEVAVFKD